MQYYAAAVESGLLLDLQNQLVQFQPDWNHTVSLCGVIQTIHFRLKLSGKSSWCYSNHSFQNQTIRQIRLVLFKPFPLVQTIFVYFKP